MEPTPQSSSTPNPIPPPKGPSHWEKEADLDEASKESFPASDAPAYAMGIEPPPADPGPNVDEQAPMAAKPPENPQLDKVVADAYRFVQPEGFKDNPNSSAEAADFEVEDTNGAE